MTEEQRKISKVNNIHTRKVLKQRGVIPNDGKIYVLHHVDKDLRINNVERYIKWIPEDLVVMTLSEHAKLHWQDKEFRERVFVSESKALTGRKLSEEHKKKLSEARKLFWKNKRIN